MSMAVVAPGRDRRPRRDWLPYAIGALTIVVLFAFLIVPIAWTAIGAFIVAGKPFAPANLTLENFERFLSAPRYQSAVINSIIVSVSASVLAVGLALPAAYALSRIRMPLVGLVLALSVVPLVAPPFIGAYSWIILLGRSGIASQFLSENFGIVLPSIYGYFGVILAETLNLVPYVLLIVQGSLAASDPALEEAAKVMGASRARILRTLTLPLMIPAIGAAAVIVFIKALGNFGVPAILGGEMYVLPTLIYFQVHGFFNLNAASAIALVNLAITALAILVLARINRRNRFVTVTGSSRRMPRIDTLGARIFANGYVWTLLTIVLLPQIVVVWMSFSERWIATPLPTQYGLANYVRVYSNLLQPFQNSFILAGAATLLAAAFGTLLAYTSVRKRFAGKWALDLTIMLPFVLPGIVTGVGFLITFNQGPLILTGTAAILILAYFVRRIAYVFRSVSAAITQIDPKIEEASTICGATFATTMRRITIPLVAPAILAGAIIVFVTLVSEMSVTILLYSARWKTISVAIFERLLGNEMPAAAAIGTVTIVFTLLLVYIASRLIGRTVSDMFK